MKKINLNLPIFNRYTQGPLKITRQEILFNMNLTEGKQIINTNPVEIGNYFHYKIFAYISIPYSYDPDLQYLTIAGMNDTSERQIKIITNLDLNKETDNIHYLNMIGTIGSSLSLWSDLLEKNLDLQQIIKLTLKEVIESLIKQLLDAGVQGVIQTDTPPIVTPDNYQDYKNMFLPQKADIQDLSLADIIQLQSIINSTYYGTVTWGQMVSFANVQGSKNDPHPPGYKTWIKLWRDKCNKGSDATYCTSYSYSNGNQGFSCGKPTDGGHVILGKISHPVNTGGIVYIYPICSKHNNPNNIDYMSLVYNPTGVILHNYNQILFTI